ncbi:MAG: alpha/beta fold hydrolase [Halobacteriaceae archaeon]
MPTVETNGVETYYERRGEGPVVVFVHASVLDHAMWDAQVEALSGDYATVTYDLRGHGRTGGSDRRAYSMRTYAADLHALLDALDVERAVLCGLSMGGCVAMTYAAAHPERVAGLVLADTFAPPIRTRGEWLLRRVVLPGLTLPVRLLGYERVERANVWAAERLVAGSGGDYGRVRALRAEGPRMATDEFAKVMGAMAGFHRESVDLGAITAPTLVCYGEDDLTFVAVHAAALASALPDATVEAIPNAGHASNLDAPKAFTAAVRSLAARAFPSGGSADRQ